MKNSAAPASTRNVPLILGIVALAFAALSWRVVSVGWILCCAVTIVSAIAAVLLAAFARPWKAWSTLGILLGLSGVVLVVYSYGHASIGAP